MSVLDAELDEQLFLIVHDRRTRTTEVTTFTDPQAAETAYDERERVADRDPDLDIVLVGSVDLDTVRITHGSYFRGQTVIVH